MSGPHDHRSTLVRGGRAASGLEGVLATDRYAATKPMTAAGEPCPIRRSPNAQAEQADELLFGETFEVLETEGGWAFGQAARDGYVGWVEAAGLAPAAPEAATHWVRAARTLALAEPSPRAPARFALSMNALVRIEAEEDRFVRVAGAGWVAAGHLAGFEAFEADPATVAMRFLGAPYRWGGRDLTGVDCSGLVQAALYACGRPCPRDSDQQAALGRAVAPGGLIRNDLAFWPGHVGMMLDGERMIHASGFAMSVVIEPLAEAAAARAELGPPVFRRL